MKAVADQVLPKDLDLDAESPAQMSPDESPSTRAQLIGELARLRRRVADLESQVGVFAAGPARSGGVAPPAHGVNGGNVASLYSVESDAGEMATLDAPGSALDGTDRAPGIQRQLLHELLANAPVIVWAVDSNGVFILGEGSHLETLGFTPGQLVGLTVDELRGRVPQIGENTRRAMAGESFTATAEVDGLALATSYSPLRDRLGDIVGAVGVSVDVTKRQQVEDELLTERRLMEALLRSHERDRRLIAYEIHDGLVQDATGAQMHLEAIVEGERVPAGPARDEIELALGLVRKAVGEGRRLISGLRPPILDECGVVGAIGYLIDDQPADAPSIEFTVDVQFERLEPLLEAALYRIAQEAIANVRQHSRSLRARVRLAQVDDRIQIEIRDWGVGFDPANVEGKRLGLEGIRERARLLRGRAVIDSAPGDGTRVFVDVPVAEAP